MRFYLAVFLFALLPAALFSRDITTLSGTTYKDVKVFDSNPRELTISYKDNDETVLKPVSFKDLPDDIKKEYKYDPVKAEAYEKEIIELGRKKAVHKNNQQESPVLVSPGGIPLAPAPLNPDQLGGGIAPGEKNGPAEGAAIKREAMENGLAPGEREAAAEGREMKKEALQNGLAPGELDGAAEGKAIKQKAMENGLPPGEREAAAEGREMKKEALGGGRAPGEK
ncbi:MAG TPA: hypothetical protein DET40_19970 [Lentisphaeria bacterium]|nr:MAG: hypothetical protein A2X45_24230 [Lentisphaerae bacterium GWF2_50_93]HCE45828.1 hypothetical protein [Lentisphaeria bacterium]